MRLRINGSQHPVNESHLRSIEERLNVALPEEYRAFLLAHNGGSPEPAGFRLKNTMGPYTDSVIDEFLAVHEGPYDNFEDYYRIYVETKRLQGNLIPIAHDPGGNLICLSTSETDKGAIYFWDHEQETDPATTVNIALIADNFKEFLSSLHEIKPATSVRKDKTSRILAENDIVGLEKLISSGWDMEAKNSMGETLIESATTRDQPEIVRLLLSKGARWEKALEIAKRLTDMNVDRNNVIRLINNSYE